MNQVKIRKKQHIDKDVYTSALERTRYIFQQYDNVIVSCSFGKDSTAVLHIAELVAKEMNRLPLVVHFFDEEAIHPPTIEYGLRLAKNPNYQLHWYCLPFKHRNACSTKSPYWYCWNPDKKDIWIREMPDIPNVITEHPAFEFGMSMQIGAEEILKHDFKGKGSVISLQGLRSQESLRRYRIIANKKNDPFISPRSKGVHSGYPIYDWSSEDVWALVHKKQIDYNKTYDIFNQTRHHGMLLHQRVCPPYGEQPIRGLWIYAECFPEMWHKMLMRVPGVNTAWRYSNTELYLKGKKPDNWTWNKFTIEMLNLYDPKTKKVIIKNINKLITKHYKITSIKIKDDTPHPVTGISWKTLADISKKGDLKDRYAQNMIANGEEECKRRGITYEYAVKHFTNIEYQNNYFNKHNK